MTDHETAAVVAFAALSGRPQSRFSVVSAIEPGVWYDFHDPDTGKYGQCMMGEDWRWKQEPRGIGRWCWRSRRGKGG